MKRKAFADAPLKAKKVALVGYASSSRGDAPWDDPEFEIWGLNMAHAWMPRWDRLFEMHTMATLEGETEECKRECDHLGVLRAERQRPIYMLKRERAIRCSVPYPLGEVVKMLGERCAKMITEPYLTSTPSYMIALAILKGASEIHAYGIDLLHDEEYAYQRSNFEMLCGFALGRGIRLHVPANSAVMTSDGLYGYANAEHMALLHRMEQRYTKHITRVIEKRDAAAMAREKAKADWNSYDGARQVLEEMRSQIWFIMRGGKI